MQFHLTAWTTLAALAIYLWTGYNVGKARVKHGVRAPLMDGPIEFMSAQRVQANTVEQLVVFLPALWMCAYFMSDRFAAAGAVLWCVGRVVYALAYYRDPARRTLGFTLTLGATVVLVGGTVAGLLMH